MKIAPMGYCHSSLTVPPRSAWRNCTASTMSFVGPRTLLELKRLPLDVVLDNFDRTPHRERDWRSLWCGVSVFLVLTCREKIVASALSVTEDTGAVMTAASKNPPVPLDPTLVSSVLLPKLVRWRLRSLRCKTAWGTGPRKLSTSLWPRHPHRDTSGTHCHRGHEERVKPCRQFVDAT